MKRVLIVDDSRQWRSQIRSIISGLGFTNIDEAINGRDALDKIKASMPDIITLDWNMPEMDGLTFLRTLRKTPGGNEPTVIFCSTEGSQNKINLVMASGADEYIVKPVDPVTFRQTFQILGLI